ncbi:hypothetical protein ABIC83_002694 [Roseateles asaccharophilus]|uniref:hypothetical protein n=1 Tax=Roseateles asaccharophilus TaxID=582607 RepID=UPI00383281FA
MESSDFTAAAKYVYDTLLLDGAKPESVEGHILMLEVDSTSPGTILGARRITQSRPDVDAAIAASENPSAAVTTALSYLLSLEDCEAAIACFVCTASRGGMTALRKVGIRVDIISADSRGLAVFEAQESFNAAPIKFRMPAVALRVQ